MNQSYEQFGELWDRVVADMEATAEEYREGGWETTTCHVGDVTPIPANVTTEPYDRVGLDALLPGDEFAELEALVADHAFDGFETYRGQTGDLVFLVLAMQDPDAELAVFAPLYYARKEAESMLAAARDRESISTYFRPLDDASRVVFDHGDPSAFFPEE